MPPIADRFYQELRARLRADQVVPVIGAGVSMAAARLPGWWGAVANGLRYVEEARIWPADQVAAARAALDAGDLVGTAQRLKGLLGAPHGEYPRWLKECFGSARLQSTDLLHAIADLGCPVLATTNYDRILSDHLPHRPQPVTWREPRRMAAALGESGRVLHLHGIYDDPPSVIFGVDDYGEVVADPAYEAVLRTLWLDRTLLFVGCSPDGLRDPDFTRLLQWAARTFPGALGRHFMLLRAGDGTEQDARALLLENRVQVLEYGKEYHELPAFLHEINPHPERAYYRRLELARDLLATARPPGGAGADPADLAALTSILGGMLRGDAGADPGDAARLALGLHASAAPPPPQPDVTEEAASALLAERARAEQRNRDDLRALQQLLATMVDPADVRREADAWHPAMTAYGGTFRETVRRAYAAMKLVPMPLLSTLQMRGVYVHDAWLSGHAARIFHFLEERADVEMEGDAYWVENAKRILTSLRAVLEADPGRLFPPPVRGVRHAPVAGPVLLVAHERHVELRALHDPASVLAELPTPEPRTRGAEIHTFRGALAVLVLSGEGIQAWDPMRAEAPLAGYAADPDARLDRAAHAAVDGRLVSAVEENGELHLLHDLEHVETYGSVAGALHSPVVLPSGRVFAVAGGGVRATLVEVHADEAVPVLTAREMAEALAAMPAFPVPLLREMRSGTSGVLLEAHLSRASLAGGEAALLLRFEVPRIAYFREADEDEQLVTGYGDLVVLMRPTDGGAAVIGYHHAAGRMLLDTTVIPGPDGMPRLLMGLLREGDEPGRVAWARGLSLDGGIIFANQGSAWQADGDVTRVIPMGDDRVIAYCNDGTLAEIALHDGSVRVLAAGGDRVVALDRGAWPGGEIPAR